MVPHAHALPPHRLALVAVAVLALALGIAIALPGAATAHTGGGNAVVSNNYGGHPWSFNGCSGSPDQPFVHACIHHDGCYGRHWASRATCDEWFRNDMYATCADIRAGWTCRRFADVYYGFVRSLGAPFYAGWSINFRTWS